MRQFLAAFLLGLILLSIGGVIGWAVKRLQGAGRRELFRSDEYNERYKNAYKLWIISFAASPIGAAVILNLVPINGVQAVPQFAMFMGIVVFAIGIVPLIFVRLRGQQECRALTTSVERASKTSWTSLVTAWALFLVLSLGYAWFKVFR